MSAEGDAPDPGDGIRAILSHIRHELRAPISAIIGYSELLLEDSTDRGEEAGELQADLESIHAAGNQLLAAVNDVGMEPDLSASMAALRHTVRPMVASLLGYSELLLEGSKDQVGEEGAGDLLRIRDAGKRLLALVEGFTHREKVDALLKKGTR